jgi:hypothetical protein
MVADPDEVEPIDGFAREEFVDGGPGVAEFGGEAALAKLALFQGLFGAGEAVGGGDERSACHGGVLQDIFC